MSGDTGTDAVGGRDGVMTGKAESSHVIRLSARAILQFRQGETDLLMAELEEKSNNLARRLNWQVSHFMKRISPMRCPRHHCWLAWNQSGRYWICPMDGCRIVVKCDYDFDPTVPRILADDREKGEAGRKGNRSGGRKHKQRRKTPGGTIAGQVPLGKDRKR